MIRKLSRIGISLVIALVLNTAIFFAIPVLNMLFFDKGEKRSVKVLETSEVEVQTQEKKKEVQKKILRTIVQPNTFKANTSIGADRSKGFKMDLSLAKGDASDGVGVSLAESDNVIYEAGEVDEEAKVLREVNPVYPERAKKAGITGYVKVFLVIDVHGNVAQAEVMSVNPPGQGFETEALKAVRAWKFEPAKLKTFPVAQKATKEFHFVR